MIRDLTRAFLETFCNALAEKMAEELLTSLGLIYEASRPEGKIIE